MTTHDSPRPSRSRAPADWSGIGDGGHAVQFFTHDRILIDLLGPYVGDAAVVVATAPHCQDLERHLARRGLDVSVARAEGRYVCLDAAETLRQVMAGSRPDRDYFIRVIGDAIDRACTAVGDGRRLSVFGELVTLEWTTEQFDAAMRLEDFWNELVRARGFSLCCAYPMDGLTSDDHAARILKVCAQHTHVFPTERRARPLPR
jgi:hypothetical protein